ncbi:hypothetical protein ACIF8T_18280 [Streptomyces sp. NPDC085946]|uniref:hypothetical protein n=1 Tax=Streptomyces sp. NPDC085946 TaxID=3365744 RepID=UPI0037D342FB
MYRQSHHEVKAAGTALAAAAVDTAVTSAVRGLPPVSVEEAGRGLLTLLGVMALTVVFELVFVTRDYRAAIPLAEDTELPPDEPLHRRLVSPNALPVLVLVTLVPALAWEPRFALLPLAMAASWAADASVVRFWERRNGRLVWRDVPLSGASYATSPVSRRPPARTASGAPPG